MSSSNLLAPLQPGEAFPCYINGSPKKTSKTFPVYDPHDRSKVLWNVHEASVDDAREAVEAGWAAFQEWKKTPLERRQAIFRRAAEIIQARAAEFVEIILEETTLSRSFAELNIRLTVANLEGSAFSVEPALRPITLPTSFPTQSAQTTREPYGVVLGISPWNAPLILSTRAVSNAIIAGNCVVLKTSELSPRGNSIIAEVLHEAGLPKGVLGVVHAGGEGTPELINSLLSNPLIRHLNFTGSSRVGSILASLSGKYLKPSIMELGGAAVFIVLEDADLDVAARNAVYGAFESGGQICMSTNCVLVHESIAPQFIALLKSHASSLRAGSSSHPSQGGNAIRGVFTDAHAQKVNGMVNDALGKGAKLVVGEEREEVEGNVLQPVVLDGITGDMAIHSEEIFGPALGIIHFSTDAEAISIANSLEYGLSGAVHSRDVERARRIAAELEINLVHVNSFTLHDSDMVPHGGWKKSGWGRFNGIEGIREFTQTKTVTYVDMDAAPIPSLEVRA